MSQYLDLYVVKMLQRAEALIPDLQPLGCEDVAYARISDDAEGLELGVTRQLEDTRALALADGIAIPDSAVLYDDDISASTLSKKPRPDFERLIAYVLTGQVNRVYAYSNSRLTRRPMELEILIQLAQQYGLKIRTKVSGDDDLNTADGRMVARIKASVDAGEAERTGERVRRQKEQRRSQGLPPGSRYRTFGYTGANVKKGVQGWQEIPEEAAIVREVFERCVKGESVNAISKDLRARGVLTVSGQPFTFAATSRMLDSPIYAGLLAHKGEVVGKVADFVPRLVSEAVFRSAGQRATKPAWNTRTSLLSGIAICDLCKTPMNHSQGAYQCARIVGGCGRVRIKREWLDEAVEHAVRFLAMWKRSQEATALPATLEPESDPVEEIDRDIAKAQAAHAAGELELVDLLPILKALRVRRAKAVEAQAAVMEEASTWAAMDDYDKADLSLQRTIIKRHIVAVPVMPSSNKGNNRYDPSRFNIVTVYKDAAGDERVLSGAACDLLGSLHGARDFDRQTVGAFENLADDVIDAVWRIVDRGGR
ncbi:MAG: recombinase family protein [Propionibacteriales bacterium]|nr:recombinase family protein [Propionibacteriales bacterium]